MSDFYGSITSSNFKYQRPIYYTNNSTSELSNVVVKLLLTSDNFNFALAKSNGYDFRLVNYDGTSVLHTWLAYWSQSAELATLFFKIPKIPASSTVTFYAYWGDASAPSISDPSSMSFLFYEAFDSTPLSSSKWGATYPSHLSAAITEHGFTVLDDIFTITNPFASKNNWVVELGMYCPLNGGAILDFLGSENPFYVEFSRSGGGINHNITEPGGTIVETETQDYGGLVTYYNHDLYVDYCEPTDDVTIKILNRSDGSPDVTYTIPRKVEGDTVLNNLKIRSNYDFYIYWLIIREWNGSETTLLDASNLYIEYETIIHEPLTSLTIGLDFTDIIYKHEASFGGNPYLLSNNAYSTITDIYVSNDGATDEDYIYMDIHTGLGNDLSSSSYTHYDSGHVNFYNASKLSDNDSDRMNRSYWKCTTTSGWAAIKFSSITNVGSFRIKATSNSGAHPKDFKFYGSMYNPVIYLDRATEIASGTFSNTADWQFVTFDALAYYKYYILDVLNTYGGSDIEIQEWELMPYNDVGRKRYVKQLRLYPVLFEELTYNFPKEIELQGSNDGITWVTLIPWTETYTPFYIHHGSYGYWQLYTFDNLVGYWSYRLLCRGNWGANDSRIAIGEWSMHELATEEYTSRILGGISNNIQQIWAVSDCGLDDYNSTLFVANDKFNKVSYDRLVDSSDLPVFYEDFNVVV